MDIICDTNIWYNIGNGNIDPSLILKKDDRLIATYINLIEFSYTPNLISRPTETRLAVQSMFDYSRNHPIIIPPFFYLKTLDDPNYKYDSITNHSDILSITQLIANGHLILEDRKDDFRDFIENNKKDIQFVTDFFNEKAREIKIRLKDLKRHRNENSIPLNNQVISHLVAKATNSNELSTNFNWGKVELFQRVLKIFFNTAETGERNIEVNDWNDVFLLYYVHPGMKYWTKEIKWNNYIKKSGLTEYLFEE